MNAMAMSSAATLRVRTIELDAVGLELLGERLEVLHFEADVIDRPALRADDRLGRLA